MLRTRPSTSTNLGPATVSNCHRVVALPRITQGTVASVRESHRQILAENANALRLLDHLFQTPLVTIGYVQEQLEVTFVDMLVSRGLLKELTGRKRKRLFRYEAYLKIFEQRGSP